MKAHAVVDKNRQQPQSRTNDLSLLTSNQALFAIKKYIYRFISLVLLDIILEFKDKSCVVQRMHGFSFTHHWEV